MVKLTFSLSGSPSDYEPYKSNLTAAIAEDMSKDPSQVEVNFKAGSTIVDIKVTYTSQADATTDYLDGTTGFDEAGEIAAWPPVAGIPAIRDAVTCPCGVTLEVTSENTGSDGLSAGAIAGIAIGVVAVVAIIGGVVVMMMMKKKKKTVQPAA